MLVAVLPNEVERLLWDIEVPTLDLKRHADFVMERVMSRGGWTAMQWLRSAYGRDDLAAFLVRKGDRLAARDLAYWSVVAGIELPISSGGGRPRWAGP
jgi:hypothetical protein